MSEAIITLSGLEKSYGAVRALDGLTAEVPAGPVGLLGPNGAGKTTLLKLLLGLLTPSGGRARIAGLEPTSRARRLAIRKLVGYMPEGDCLLPEMSGVEQVATLARITGLRRADAMTRAHEVLDYVELDEARYRQLEEYSTGMKQRLKLAQALVHDPAVLLLDEPTNGLDPKGRRHMLALIEDLGRVQHKNVLLCSHLLPDVERTCDHVLVLHRGKVVEQGAVSEMTRAEGLRLIVAHQGGERFAAALGQAGYTVERQEAGKLVVHLAADVDDADGIFAVAAQQAASITAIERVRSSLEEVFLRAVGISGASPKMEDPA